MLANTILLRYITVTVTVHEQEFDLTCNTFFYRYGDALNPWGDIITIARGWCVTKKGGSLTIGVPYRDTPQDMMTFNEARHYGHIRYPYLVTNWQQLYRGTPFGQQVFVFKRVG